MSKYEAQLTAARLALRKDREALGDISSDAAEAEAQYLADWQQSDQLLRRIEGQMADERQHEPLKIKKSFFGLIKSTSSAATIEVAAPLQSERRKILDRMDLAARTIQKERSLAASIEDRKDAILRLEALVVAESATNQRLAIDAQKKHTREQAARAKVAAYDRRSRELAAQIKKRIHRQDHCPYCGGALSSDAHADHIYPVTKGGLSTAMNLVFVCGPCNMRKRDMTLTSFIRTFGLNREEIEARLSILGKDF